MASILSKIGSGIRRAAPEMIRGAIVAAANPTRGAVGTAGDIFGAIGAVEDDRMARMERQRQREIQALEMRRKEEEDAREAALNEARIAELNQRAEYQTRRGTQQAQRPAAPTKVDLMRQQVELFREIMKRDPSERELQTMLGTHGPQYDLRSDEAYWTNQLAAAQTPEERTGIQAAREAATKALASAKSAGAAEGKAPFMRPFSFQTEGGAKLVRPSFLGGKMAGVEEQDIQFAPRQPAPRQATASDERLSREKTISSIVNRVLKEDSSGRPENALRNVQQFYQNDPEVQQYKAEVMARLQKLVQGKATTGKAEKFIEVQDKAKEIRSDKPKGAVEKWIMDPSGNLVRAK